MADRSFHLRSMKTPPASVSADASSWSKERVVAPVNRTPKKVGKVTRAQLGRSWQRQKWPDLTAAESGCGGSHHRR